MTDTVEVENKEQEAQKTIKSDKGEKPKKNKNPLEVLKDLVNREQKEDEKRHNKLKRVHKKNNAVDVLEPIDDWAYYALDMKSINNGEHQEVTGRGFLKFATYNDWADFIHENSETCAGFKPIRGSMLRTKHNKVLAILRGKAKRAKALAASQA